MMTERPLCDRGHAGPPHGTAIPHGRWPPTHGGQVGEYSACIMRAAVRTVGNGRRDAVPQLT
jgi:hypothetical protein